MQLEGLKFDMLALTGHLENYLHVQKALVFISVDARSFCFVFGECRGIIVYSECVVWLCVCLFVIFQELSMHMSVCKKQVCECFTELVDVEYVSVMQYLYDLIGVCVIAYYGIWQS